MQPLVSSLRDAGTNSPDATLKVVVPAYVAMLDSLRVINLETTLGQRRKRDVYVTVALVLSATSLGIASTGIEDGTKATLTGIAAALSGLATALNAKFRHEEDAALSEACAKIVEGELVGFQIPANVAAFDSVRTAFAKTWKEAGCPAAQTRFGVSPTPKPKPEPASQ